MIVVEYRIRNLVYDVLEPLAIGHVSHLLKDNDLRRRYKALKDLRRLDDLINRKAQLRNSVQNALLDTLLDAFIEGGLSLDGAAPNLGYCSGKCV